MISNFLKITLRRFRKQAFFSAVNLLGLSIGMAACLTIALFVQNEWSFDRSIPNADRICAVALDLKSGDQEGITTNTPPPLGPRLAADFPEIEQSARTFALQNVVVRREQPGHAPRLFNESMAFAVDTSFLELFDFPMQSGDAASALDLAGGLVLTSKMAAKYFGHEPAPGQTLYVNDRPFKVTGVAENLPATATVQFDFLLPVADFKVVDRFSWSWIWLQMDTWVRLREKPQPESLAKLEDKFPAMVLQYAPAAYERIGQNFEESLKNGDRYAVRLLPLKTLHLGAANLETRLVTLGDRKQVNLFALTGLLILVLACVNFMNLSTARSMKRAREVGVRKALGSQRSALIRQFMGEALLYSVAAAVLGVCIAAAAFPLLNQFTGFVWTISSFFSPSMLGVLVSIPVLTGILGGLYPALYLSGFNSSEIFRTAPVTATGGGHTRIRSGLVVFQFSVSVALMLGSLVIFKQLEFARTHSPGLQRENVLIIQNTKPLETGTKLDVFKRQLAQMPEAISVSHSAFLPSQGSFGDFYEPEQGNQSHAVTQSLLLSSYLTDAEFVPTLGLEVIQGRNFLPDSNGGDSTSVLLNETAVKAIGWENPIGKWMRYPGNANQRFQVVGVVRDFYAGSIKSPIEPIAIFHESSQTYRVWSSCVTVRLKPGSAQPVLDKASAIWKSGVPEAPFEYDFLDASFARLYGMEAKTASVLGIFTGLALFIGCLGLFALAVFTAEQRTKEIGIRKVLGASVAGLMGLLTKDFMKLVFFAILIASPLAWYVMQTWLANFAYQIKMQWWMFAATGAAATGIAFLTVGIQSVKAALADPVKSLRNE